MYLVVQRFEEIACVDMFHRQGREILLNQELSLFFITIQLNAIIALVV